MRFLIVLLLILNCRNLHASSPWHPPEPEASTLGPCIDSNCNAATDTSAATTSATPSADGTQCVSSFNRTRVACNGIVFSSVAQVILGQFQAAKSDGNVKEACEKAAQLNKIGGLLNLAFAVTCQQAQAQCVRVCEAATRGPASEQIATYEANAAYCQEKSMIANLSMVQVAMNATQFAGSKACADAASGKCIGENAFNDEECIQFCQKPGRQQHPKCVQTIASCSDATYRSQNSQLCTCMTNPSAQGCGGLQLPPITVPTTTVDTTDPFENLGELPPIDEYTGNPEKLSDGSKVNSPGGGGSGGGLGGGGGSSPFGQNDGQGGTGDEALDKDILGGQGGGGGGVPVGGGSGGYEGGGGAAGSRNGNGSGKDSPGFDLRAFLPGGKKDPKRGLASAGYADQSITAANGLTNFEKVTKRMNQKQPELLP